MLMTWGTLCEPCSLAGTTTTTASVSDSLANSVRIFVFLLRLCVYGYGSHVIIRYLLTADHGWLIGLATLLGFCRVRYTIETLLVP